MIKLRPGVILTHICDQSLLVAAYEARQYCPYVTVLNETGELIWNCLNDEKSIIEIIDQISQIFDIPSNVDLEELIVNYIEQLHENGYVLYEEETEP